MSDGNEEIDLYALLKETDEIKMGAYQGLRTVDFLLGIIMGVAGNFIVSYWIEFQKVFLGLSMSGIIYGLILWSACIWLFYHRVFKKSSQLFTNILEVEALRMKVYKSMLKSQNDKESSEV